VSINFVQWNSIDRNTTKSAKFGKIWRKIWEIWMGNLDTHELVSCRNNLSRSRWPHVNVQRATFNVLQLGPPHSWRQV
jgi:hypothetical protein